MARSPYPFHLTPGGPALLDRALRKAFGATAPGPDARLLLVGSRYGENLFGLLRGFPGRITGIDEDTEGVFYAKMLRPELDPEGRTTVRIGAAHATGDPPDLYDAVILDGVLSSGPARKIVREAARVVAPGGVVIAADSCWLEPGVPTFAHDVWETERRKVQQLSDFPLLFSGTGLEVLYTEDASSWLGGFYAQFGGTVRGIVHDGFEGMKHHRALVKHYKHEIDIYLRHGGARYMGYAVLAARAPAEATAGESASVETIAGEDIAAETSDAPLTPAAQIPDMQTPEADAPGDPAAAG
jgi:SAM-dependent methyltransferase